MVEHVRQTAALTGRGGLLDLGCGPGRLTLALAPHFADVLAVDLESEMIEVGRQEAEQRGIGNVRWQVGRAEDAEAPAGVFELVTMGESFHRLDQPVMLERIWTWLRPGGCVGAMGGTSVLKTSRDPWVLEWRNVWDRWQTPGAAAAHPAARQPILTSGQIFREAGYTDVTEVELRVPHVWTVEALIGNAYSTSVMARKVLGARASEFEADVRRTMLALNPKDEFPEQHVWWCALGRRPG